MIILSQDGYYIAGLQAILKPDGDRTSYYDTLFDVGFGPVFMFNASEIQSHSDPLLCFIYCSKLIFNKTDSISKVTDTLNSKVYTPLKPSAFLSFTEISILRFFCNGVTSWQISRTLVMSVKTVNTHKRNALHKLDFKNFISFMKVFKVWSLLYLDYRQVSSQLSPLYALR